MQGDPVHAVDGVVARLGRLREEAAMRVALRDRLKADIATMEAEREDLSKRVVLLLKVGELFHVLMDRMVSDHVEAIRHVVSEGLATIFHDQQLSFEAEVGVKYNKVSIDFALRQGSGLLAIEGKPLESFGGGPSSISSLLLRVLTLLRLRVAPVLFLDETLSAVSDEYIDQTGRFLAHLASQIGTDVLMVTHKSAFLDHADLAYQGSEVCLQDGSRHLTIKVVHENRSRNKRQGS
jgi:hypothetical protein